MRAPDELNPGLGPRADNRSQNLENITLLMALRLKVTKKLGTLLSSCPYSKVTESRELYY